MAFTTYTRTLNATVEWYDTGIAITAGQQVIISASGFVKPWPSWPNPGIGPAGDPTWPTECTVPPCVIIPGARFCKLLGRIGSMGTPFQIGAYRNLGEVGSSGNLYLAINDVTGAFGDNSGSFSVTIRVGLHVAADHEKTDNACFAFATKNSQMGPDPISLYDGEKREEVTDLSVNTPAGALTFTRTYRQSKLGDANYQFMGLGWTHNHFSKLTLTGTSPNRTADILLPGGGLLKLTEDSANPGQFNANAGSTAKLAYDSGANEYVLTAQDKSTYVFDGATFQLERRSWPSTETWTYTYASGKLSEIADGYGRKLQFAYVSNPGQYNDGRLWRVGDHTTTNLSGTPSGRYVEFGYVQEKSNGVIVSNPKALLSTVRDARGNTWSYDWYGQDSGESDANKLNFLLEVISPSVDTTGDGVADGSIKRKQLTYVLSGGTITSITQKRGIQGANPALLETEYAFQPSGQNITTEVTAGKQTTHHFSGGVFAGTSDPAGNRSSEWLALNYRPDVEKDANGNETSLLWSDDAKYLQKVTNALGNETAFSYNTSGASADTLKDSVDAQGRKTEYTYGDVNNPRLPTRIKVFDTNGTTVLRWQEFTYDSKGRVLTEKLLDPANGVTLLQQITREYYDNTDPNGYGLLKQVIQEDMVGSNDVTTTYFYDPAGRVVQTNQSSNFGSCSKSRTVYDDAGNVVATLCNFEPGTVNPIYPTTVAQAKTLRQRLYNTSDPDHYTDPNSNRLTIYDYDTLGRRVKTINDAEDPYQIISLTFFDALDRVVRTITNYVNQSGGSAEEPGLWVWDATDGRWEKNTGAAISHGADNNQNVITDTAYNARGMVRLQRDPLGNVTLFGYDDAGRLVKTIQSASQPTYNNDYTSASPDPTLGSYSPSGSADKDIITSQSYDKAGNLVKSVDALGVVSYTAYDALNRPVKAVRAAKDAATITLNPGDIGYNAANDPRSDSYTPSTDPDRDLIETTEYDALSRVVRTKRLMDNRPTAVWDTRLFGYDPLGRQVKVIRSASQPNYNIASDPDLSDYVASSSADQDIITRTIYDVQGRVLETEAPRDDTLVTKTRFVYDGLGRQVKIIANYVAQGASDPKDWVWDATDNRWEYPTNNPVSHGTNNDQNLITETVYDSDGRVQSTRDVLGRVSRNVYDSAGRVFRTVTTYVAQGASDPKDWVWDATDGRWEYPTNNPISHGTDNDQNIIASTVYDDQGRVFKTIDHRNNETLHVYDVLGRRVKTITNYVPQGMSNPANWLWDTADNRWEDGGGNAISFGTDKDQNRIVTTAYDLAGRVIRTRDAAGIETRYEYDASGRQTKTIANYVDGTFSASFPDEDLISTTAYNKGGQITSTTDARGTQTAFTYDKAGRRLTVIQAASSPLVSTSYTNYDKAGRMLREIRNYVPLDDAQGQPIPPDAKDGSGNWLFVPPHNGQYNDRNLITVYAYDLASRRVSVTDPVGGIAMTAYFKDGQVKSVTDPETVVAQYRYDAARRRTRVVAGFADQGEDPSLWVWDAGDVRWEKSGGTAIAHGSNNDQNIIVLVAYDRAGRMVSLRDPRGNLTTYEFDLLDRRKSLTNPISKTWQTAFPLLATGGTRTILTDPNGVATQRDFDRLGRLASIQYGSPANTPDVKFTYNNTGNREKMSEYSGAGFTNRIRETNYTFDDVHRPTSIGFDNDGNGTVDETVSYEYDAGGLRTKLTLPGNLNVVYTYDPRGQLVSLTDWDNQQTQFAYDLAGRLIVSERANGLRSRYHHDAAGRLRLLRHTKDFKTLGHFEYQVDKRGNRVQALECLPHPVTTNDTIIAYNDKSLVLKGTWSEVSGFKESSQFSASLKLIFFGDEATLTMGTGPDHSIYDVYIGGVLWQSFDGYAASASQRDIVISAGVDSRKLQGEGPHLLEIRNRAEKNLSSSGYKVRFKQLLVADRTYDLHTIEYIYDNLSRLTEARYNPGTNLETADGDLLRRYQYAFDLAGNRTQQIVSVVGTPTTTNYSYNAANQLTGDGTYTYEYDSNGNLWKKKLSGNDVEIYTWNRVNRLVTWDNGTPADKLNYAYDGLNNRISRSLGTTSPVVTKYLLDLQPGLSVVLAETVGANTKRFVHAPMGIHAQEDASGVWTWAVQDALGNVRLEASNAVAVNGMRNFAPYGVIFGQQGSFSTPYGFTGEQTDGTGQVYLRARYYNPNIGVFDSLDPVEGKTCNPMSLNGYSYVEANPVNIVDPTGMFGIFSTFGLMGSPAVAEILSSGLCFGLVNFAMQGSCPLCGSGSVGEAICSFFGMPCAPTSAPPTPTPGITTCDPALLPPINQVFAETFRTPAGTVLDPTQYTWRPAPYHIRLSQYGAAPLPVSDISQISREQAYVACCGNGVVAVGEQIYKCTAPPPCITDTVPADFQVTPGLFQVQNDPTCSPHPLLANNTCAIPGRTGAVSTRDAFIGSDNIGRAFVHFIPDNGSAPVSLYINDGGGGTRFERNQIDVYVGRLQPDSIVPVEGRSFSGLTGTACVLARTDRVIPTPQP